MAKFIISIEFESHKYNLIYAKIRSFNSQICFKGFTIFRKHNLFKSGKIHVQQFISKF